jgi:hypothetical protein
MINYNSTGSTDTLSASCALYIERYDILQLPTDPYILLSYINTKLRDDYSSLNKLCSKLELDRDYIENNYYQ